MAEVPYIYFLGQEPAVHGALSEAYITNNDDAALTGSVASVTIYDYHLTATSTYNSTPAAALSCTQVAGDKTDVACDVTMVRDLKVRWPSGFSMCKRYVDGNVGNSGSNRWGKTYAESYPTFAAADTALRAAITGAGDTVGVKAYVLSFGYTEGVTGDPALDATFKVDYQQLIDDLRTDYGEAPVVMELPPATVAGYTAAQLTSLANARKVIKELAAEVSYITYVETDDLVREATTGVGYTGTGTMELGRRLASQVGAVGIAPLDPVTGGGDATYVLLGDNNCVGSVAFSYLSAGDDAAYDGPQTGVKTWNWSTNTWSTYDGTANSNTDTDGLSNFGPDASMVAGLLEQNPAGVKLFKLGRDDSALGNESATGGTWLEADADIWTSLAAEWSAAKAAAAATEGVMLDVRGVVIVMGYEDAADATVSAAYATNLASFVRSVRSLFKTRTGQSELPVVLVQVVNTAGLADEYAQTVRRTTQEFSRDAKIQVLNIDDLGVNADGKTLSGSGLVQLGQRCADALEVLSP